MHTESRQESHNSAQYKKVRVLDSLQSEQQKGEVHVPQMEPVVYSLQALIGATAVKAELCSPDSQNLQSRNQSQHHISACVVTLSLPVTFIDKIPKIP